MLRSLLAFLLIATSSLPIAAQQTEEPCDCEVQRPVTLAIVDGVEIPTIVVESDVVAYVAPIKEQMAKVREQALQTMITNRLVELEAAKRGMTFTRYLQTEIVSKIPEPTEDEVRAFYDRNRAGLEGRSYEEVREHLVQYIRSQRQQGQLTIVTTDLRANATIEVLDYTPDPPATAADRAKVLAIVNGSKITSGELEDNLRTPIYQLRRQIYTIEREALENRIDDALIEREAKRRNITAQALVDAEIKPRVKKVDAFDASKFYNENKDRFGGRSFAEVKDDLMRLLELEEVLKAKRAYANTLRQTATIKINLVEPAEPVFKLENDGRPVLGSQTAPVTVVVFSDFECPRCAITHEALEELAKEYAGKVRVVARNYPLEQHENAYKAAIAAEAAHEQGKYWEYAKLLFANQKSLSVEKLKELATQAGLDRAKFDAALDAAKFSDVVDRDLSEGNSAGVLGTPAVYVNGKPIDDDTHDGIKAAIETALRERG